MRDSAPRPRLGVILWWTALLLAALDVQTLNWPEARPRPAVHVTP